METLQEIPFKTYKDRIFERLGELSRTSNLSDEEREQYDDYLKWARDHNAELRYEREERLKAGRREGRLEGLKAGRQEEKLTIARNLLSMGMSSQEVSKATGLSESELKSLG